MAMPWVLLIPNPVQDWKNRESTWVPQKAETVIRKVLMQGGTSNQGRTEERRAIFVEDKGEINWCQWVQFEEKHMEAPKAANSGQRSSWAHPVCGGSDTLCEGGELLDRILSRGGKYTEEDAKVIILQILSVVAFCHLQGVVHQFPFTSRSENADMRLIDFGLSDFIRPDERLNDIVGSAYYVAPEVLHRSYSLEADIWSIGVIPISCYVEVDLSGHEQNLEFFVQFFELNLTLIDLPWPSASAEAKDFVKRLLNKDYRKRMTAVQALSKLIISA
ncbi:Protein kinase domain [Sesbania bispinosa]|nr:Protein kinase domain [Sesbania bispinosa]